MTWRVVTISSNSKLDLKLNYLVIRDGDIRKVHLSEISVLIIESTAVSITSMLLCEMSRRKIKIVFCDETHNPYGELYPYYGSYDSVDKLRSQMAWSPENKKIVWTEIVKEKIKNQATVLSRYDYDRASILFKYVDEVQLNDVTNREGHAAKVYFNSLFGNEFSRRNDSDINLFMNYGYAILLSAVNREIVASGYSTQLGIFHDNASNHFNLGSDLMEPFRPLIDQYVIDIYPAQFDTSSKRLMANVLNTTVIIEGKKNYLNNAIGIYVRSVLSALESGDVTEMIFHDCEGKSNEVDCVL